MIIYIKLPDKTKHPLSVDEKMSVLSLKNLIFESLHINILSQRLMYNGTPLPDEYTLYQFKITENSIIDLLYQMC